MAEKATNYELAFHLNSDIEDSKISQLKKVVEDAIISSKGLISYSKDPERIHLSYPINHNNFGYFGFFQFSLSDLEMVANLNDQIKHNPDILRYLLIKIPVDGHKAKSMVKQMKTKERVEKKPKPKQVTPEESKKIDEKLEEIIEKL